MKLHEYQSRIASQITGNKILSIGLGLGKTIISLTYLSRINPASAIIVAPKQVTLTVWKQEAEKWNMDIAEKMIIVAGPPSKRRSAIENDDFPYKVISRENLKDVENMTTDLLILDELTSFKNINSNRYKYIRSIRSKIKIGLTGTFLANGAIDIWGQASAAGILPKTGYYSNFYSWRHTFFYNAMEGSGQKFEKWVLKKGVTISDILEPIKDKIVTLKSEDYISLPKITFVKKGVKLHPDEKKEYLRLKTMLSIKLDDITYSFKEREKFFKLQTAALGFVYLKSGETVRGKRTSKIDQVADLCDHAVAEGEQILLFYAFREEAIILAEKFKKLGIRYCSPQNKDYMKLWKEHKIDILISHPASIAHGINLQHESRIIIWSSITWNMELFLQGNGRIARQGQQKPVYIYTFLAEDTIEQGQYYTLMTKVKEQENFVEQTRILI